MQQYRETQRVALWVYALLAGIIFMTICWPLMTGIGMKEEKEFQVFLVSALAVAIVIPLVMNLLWLRTEVLTDKVYMRLGLLFPMMWRRIPLADIESVAVIAYRPLRDAGGWGYRLGRYEGERCWYYTMRGTRGVLVRTRDGKLHIIGSQVPEKLATAIESARTRQGNPHG